MAEVEKGIQGVLLERLGPWVYEFMMGMDGVGSVGGIYTLV